MTRVIGMLSPSWSGSTLWNLVLDGLPGVAGVGEDHWIVDARAFERPYYCTECRDDPCPVFTTEALDLLSYPGATKRWWDILSSITGCSTIVTSDKGPHHYDRFGQPDIFIIPYKDARAHVASYVVNWRRRNKSMWDKCGTLMSEVKPTEQEILDGIPWVMGNYRWVLDYAESSGKPWVPLRLEDLAQHPYRTLRAVCERLGLTLDFSALEFWSKPHHHIGGNFSVRFHHGADYPSKGVERGYAHEWQEKFKQRIVVDDKWRTILLPGQPETILESPLVAEVYERLEGST
jgi:hypothetical protein